MLEQHRVSATGGTEETGAEVDVHQHHRHATGQYRHHRNQQERGDQPGPDEQRHFHQRHAGGAQVEDGGDHVDRAHDRTDPHQVDGEDEEGHAFRRIGRRQRRIERPAEVRPATGSEQGRHQHQERRRQQPEAEVVHARQGHVRRADHQRDHPVGEADEGRHHRTEDHHQTVHGGHLVEELRLDDLQPRLEQLGANNHRERTAKQEHGERKPQVQGADVLVVGGQHPAHQAFGGAVGVVGGGMNMFIDYSSHVLSPANRWTGRAGVRSPDRFLTCAIDRVICFPPVSAPALLLA
ncbi:hypothetical protein D3C85_379420 [compost metagenome]